MQRIADWLERLGLTQYAQRFAENDINFSILPDLTDQDLKEIGVASLGHRRQLLRAIADLKDDGASKPAATTSFPVAPQPHDAAERRHVTVMFSDLVNSTGIAARLDAEEWRDLIGAYLDAASAAIMDMGGKVAKKLGDGVMALFGYPVAQENDAERAVRAALSIQRSLADLNRRGEGTGKPALGALRAAGLTHILCGDYAAAVAQSDELVALADEKGTVFRKALGMMNQGCVLILTGKASDAIQMITSGIAALQPMGATIWMPWFLSHLAMGYAELAQWDDAWPCIGEAMTAVEATKDRWCEAEVNRIAGEIALMSTQRDVAKAEAYFERALDIARAQQAKSWELRAAMSLAGLWRDQGKREQARNLLAPVYGWFTEGFDTLDLKEAKALLEQLSA